MGKMEWNVESFQNFVKQFVEYKRLYVCNHMHENQLVAISIDCHLSKCVENIFVYIGSFHIN